MTNTYFNKGKVRTLGNPFILNLGEIIRYNNRPKIKHENVAAHSFYVVQTVLRICQMYRIDDATKLKALEFATVHDIPEMFTGDMPYDTKVANPSLAALLNMAELEELEKHMPDMLPIYNQLCKEEKVETVAAIICKLADTTSVLQYSNLELQLGNRTPQMKEINDGAQERVAQLVDKLESKLNLFNGAV